METKFKVQSVTIDWDNPETGWSGHLEVCVGVEGIEIICRGVKERASMEIPVEVAQLLVDAFDSLGVR